MIYTTDDLCLSNLHYFSYWDRIKEIKPELKLIAFTIANYCKRENVGESKDFKEWFNGHKDWVDIGVHGYDHEYPPEGERDNQEELIRLSLEILKPFLKEKYLYRAPGFQTTCKTEPIVKALGFAGIAHQNRIKYFDGSFEENVVNTHCCDKWDNPITKVWDKIC